MKQLQLPGGWLAEIHFQTCQKNRRHWKRFFFPALSHLLCLKYCFLKHFNFRGTSIYFFFFCPDNFPLKMECLLQMETTAQRDFSPCKALSNLTWLSQSLKSIVVVGGCLYPQDLHLSFFFDVEHNQSRTTKPRLTFGPSMALHSLNPQEAASRPLRWPVRAVN